MNSCRAIAGAALIGVITLIGCSTTDAVVLDPPAPAAPQPAPAGSQLTHVPMRLETEGRPPPSIEQLRMSLEEGDVARALWAALPLAQSAETPRERDMASMAAGWLYRTRQKHNLASESFGRIRAGNGPLAPLAAYFEAEEDWRRGQFARAIERCEQYRKRWPTGEHASDCLRIFAHANASLGKVAAARAAAQAYDSEHDTGRITEQIEVAIGTQLVETDPSAAAAIFRQIAVEHGAALAGRVAEEQLAALAARGVRGAVIPSDPDSMMKRALSLRESGRRDAAWALFEELRSSRNAGVVAWVEEESERFGWQTQRWPWLVDEYGARYASSNDPIWSWKRYSALARSGRFGEAADYALKMQKKHPTSRQWKRSEEEIGRTMMLAKRYTEAREQFDAVAARGGTSGKRAAFSAAFSAFMAGDDSDAIKRLSDIVATDPSTELEARYWRARAHIHARDVASAEVDRQWILETEPWSWYAALVRKDLGDVPTVSPFARMGRWAGDAAPAPDLLDLSMAPEPATSTGLAPRPLPAVFSPKLQSADPGFASWSWGIPPEDPYLEPPMPVVLEDPERRPPRDYQPSALWDPQQARSHLREFSEQYAGKWPELALIHDLTTVGLYDLSGPMLSSWYETWRLAERSKDATARKLSGTAPEAWRELFLAGRDHHNTARSSYAWWEAQTDASLAMEAYRLGYPVAHGQPVWENSRSYDLDPYLVLGLMRQESTYNSTAKSRVGARGAMQIMPRTGHLLADLAHDTQFDAGDLEDPTVAVGYGIRYLGLLIARFDGVYPLAVASYNAGPFNVSNWLSGTGLDVPLDVFIEHIPYRETRNYVKKVTSGYAAYIALYTAPGSAMLLPERPLADRREVVDF